MSTKRKIVVGGATAATLFVVFLLIPGSGARRAAEETRRILRQQGFKVELTEFSLTNSPESRARAAALIKPSSPFPNLQPGESGRLARISWRVAELDLLPGVGTNSAVVLHAQDVLSAGNETTVPWAILSEVMTRARESMDTAQASLLSGPISFELDLRAGHSMLLPHLGVLGNLARSLGARAILNLHEGASDAAWSDMLSATRLFTAWNPEPAEHSHLVRFSLVTIAYNSVWQAIQAGGWTDDQLAALQREWESADLFMGLPETAAFTRASMLEACRQERLRPVGRPAFTLGEVMASPQAVWYALIGYWEALQYRRQGSYHDEKSLLLYYRDREEDLRHGIQCSTWIEMLGIAGVTNLVPFQSRYPSQLQSMINTRQLMLAWTLYSSAPGAESRNLLGRAAEAEARRRIVVTALALERHRLRHRSYPSALAELVPEFLKAPPLDFIDGKPLRYRRTDEGHFMLYSVGTDCADDGGILPRRRSQRMPSPPPRTGIAKSADLVWPLPASPADVENQRQEQLKAEAEFAERRSDLSAEMEWQSAEERQAGAGRILQVPLPEPVPEPLRRGRALSPLQQIEKASGTNGLAWAELLALRQVATGQEPERVTFESPLPYDVLTNLGSLHLLVDYGPPDELESRFAAGQFECQRADNGNSRVVWHTIYESPGTHALRLGFDLTETEEGSAPILGPATPFSVTNLCQFSVTSATFDPRFGATLRAKLPESRGTYSLTILSPTGERLNTLSGSTTNGVVKVHWDLKDEQGRRCTNEFFDTILQITLPESGRSQTLKGP